MASDLKELSADSEKSFTSLVAAICAETMTEQEAAFYLAKGNQSLWSRMKAGEPGVNLKANDLLSLPPDRRRRIVERWAALEQLEVVSRERKRMAIAKAIGALAEVVIVIEESA